MIFVKDFADKEMTGFAVIICIVSAILVYMIVIMRNFVVGLREKCKRKPTAPEKQEKLNANET